MWPWVARTWPPAESDDFTVAVLPDTQNYAALYPTVGLAQTTWIKAHVVPLNIKMVLHEGDVVNLPSVEAEWQTMRATMDVLGADIPNLIAPGNHDYANQDPEGRDLTKFNQYFPSTRYTDAGWFNGGLANAGASENVYTVVTVDGVDYLFLALEYAPRAAIVTWANGILTANSSALAIITTHIYLYVNDNRTPEGQALWDDLIKLHDNVICVLCGHLGSVEDCQGYRVDDSLGGQPVHQILANYQFIEHGGDGYLRVMRFVPSTRRIYIETYSPYLEQWRTSAEDEFNVEY